MNVPAPRPAAYFQFCLFLTAAVLFPARSVRAEGSLRLNVVGDVTEAGKQFAHPTPQKPVYYLPNTVGYKARGGYLAWEKPPPLTPEVEHLIAIALYEQGYRVATKLNPPSIVLVFWWGYIAPQMLDTSMMINIPGLPSGAAAMAESQSDGYGGTTGDGHVTTGIGGTFVNQGEMLTLLAGDKYDSLPQASMSFKSSPLRDEINHAELEAHYYVMITAFDFQAALKKKMIKLWTARMSTGTWGTSLDKVLPALVEAGRRIFGRDTMPRFIEEPVDPMGRVILGAPEIKDFPRTFSAPSP